jgi:hypothetical protein
MSKVQVSGNYHTDSPCTNGPVWDGTSRRGKDIKKGHSRVNMVEILCTSA